MLGENGHGQWHPEDFADDKQNYNEHDMSTWSAEEIRKKFEPKKK